MFLRSARGDTYMEDWSLPTVCDFGHVGILCTFSYIPCSSFSSWNCLKLSAEQLFAKAGGTVCHGRRFGPPVTVQIIAPPPLSSRQAGQHAVLGQFSTAFGLCVLSVEPAVAAPKKSLSRKKSGGLCFVPLLYMERKVKTRKQMHWSVNVNVAFYTHIHR